MDCFVAKTGGLHNAEYDFHTMTYAQQRKKSFRFVRACDNSEGTHAGLEAPPALRTFHQPEPQRRRTTYSTFYGLTHCQSQYPRLCAARSQAAAAAALAVVFGKPALLLVLCARKQLKPHQASRCDCSSVSSSCGYVCPRACRAREKNEKKEARVKGSLERFDKKACSHAHDMAFFDHSLGLI